MNKPIITFSDLGYAYKPGQWVLRHYTAQIYRGEIFSILGPNGCGKTTLLKAILGLLKPKEGHIQTEDTIAFVPQLFNAGFDYSVLEMVLMGRARQIRLFAQPSTTDEKAAIDALERVGMANYAERPFHELSGGQRQLVILARALASGAEILILDEPTSALDLKNQDFVLHHIQKLSREDGLTVIFTTHHPHHALAVADRVLLMLPDTYLCDIAETALCETNLLALYDTPMKRLHFEYHGNSVESIVPVYLPR